MCIRDSLVGNAFGDAVAERGQNYHRDVLVLSLDGSRYVKSLIISCSRHTYNLSLIHIYFKVVCLIGSVFIPEFHSVGSGGERMSSCYGLFLVTPIIGL